MKRFRYLLVGSLSLGLQVCLFCNLSFAEDSPQDGRGSFFNDQHANQDFFGSNVSSHAPRRVIKDKHDFSSSPELANATGGALYTPEQLKKLQDLAKHGAFPGIEATKETKRVPIDVPSMQGDFSQIQALPKTKQQAPEVKSENMNQLAQSPLAQSLGGEDSSEMLKSIQNARSAFGQTDTNSAQAQLPKMDYLQKIVTQVEESVDNQTQPQIKSSTPVTDNDSAVRF